MNTGAKARADFTGFRGPEGPLFHGDADILEFLRNL